ncbi:MAG: [citrate (pro-3S)-lyase] ligase [Defluviitaleaceae bacterium]|nr:[citrate (pro-3S)-lyase] ligase [Defluviitaleaceae bacterium]
MSAIVSEITRSDKRGNQQFDKLLQNANIKRDNNLDYIAGIYDADYNLIAAGGCFGNTLRCLAVDEQHQGDGLMAPVVTHLLEHQMSCGNRHVFLYTKCDNAAIFSSLGFYEIARVDNEILLMENLKNGFDSFLENLRTHAQSGSTAALVMNCNPFTLGHRYLVEYAAKKHDTVHLFVVSEDLSLFPFADRYKLIKEGCADLTNVTLHTTGSYMVSTAVFPSYFLKDETAVIEAQTRLDIAIFKRIAQAINTQTRYVGEEPFSLVTGIYNKTMQTMLPLSGIECVVVPRKEQLGAPISASRVRKLLQEGRLEGCKDLVPPTTYNYFFTENGKKILAEIQNAENVVHY